MENTSGEWEFFFQVVRITLLHWVLILRLQIVLSFYCVIMQEAWEEGINRGHLQMECLALSEVK